MLNAFLIGSINDTFEFAVAKIQICIRGMCFPEFCVVLFISLK